MHGLILIVSQPFVRCLTVVIVVWAARRIRLRCFHFDVLILAHLTRKAERMNICIGRVASDVGRTERNALGRSCRSKSTCLGIAWARQTKFQELLTFDNIVVGLGVLVATIDCARAIRIILAMVGLPLYVSVLRPKVFF